MAGIGIGQSVSSSTTSYKIQRYLGSGNVGYVSEFKREDTYETVALKISSGPRQIRGAKYEEINLQKLRELNAEHFNIVKWKGSFTFEELHCLEFEKLDVNLSEFIKSSPSRVLNLRQIHPILQQLATALVFLKSKGIIHGDLKPQNIMLVDQLNEPLRVKVIDFGLALDNPAERVGDTIQTLPYRCPEVLLGAPFNEAVDVWSLGCTAAEMLKGRQLFDARKPCEVMEQCLRLIGEPGQEVLLAGQFTGRYFCPSTSEGTKLWKPEPSYPKSWLPERERSLEDWIMWCDQTSVKDGDAGECDLAKFLNLLKQMLNVDPSERITPRGILEHPFITMSHLQGEFKNKSYVETSIERMKAVKPPQEHCPAGVSAEEPCASQASTSSNVERRKRKKCGNRGALSGKGHGAAAAAAGATLLGWSSTRGYLTVIPKTRHPASHVRVVDLRTDSVTKPGPAMLQAMVAAAVRPELIKDDPIVDELQKMTADMFGMEDALFLPSGTMGNLVAVMSHCWGRGNEMIVGDLSHMHIYEQGSSAQVAGVHSTTVTTLPNGTFDLDELESKIRHNDPSLARSRLICLENTHNIQGGRVLPLTFLQEVRALADRYGLSVHMDGARLLNAAVAQGVPPHTILQHTHSVTMCLNKGLGAPVGSVLAGSKDFINRAVRARHALGGRMSQISLLAAAGRVSLLDMVGRLEEDHRNAKTFAQALLDCDPPLFAVDMASVETNMVVFRLREPSLSPSEFCTHMVQVGEGEEAALGQVVQVAMIPFFGNSVRAVWHLGISPEDTQLAIQKMQYVVSQYSKDKRLCSASV